MKNILLTILFTFSVSLLQADDKHVIIKKIIVGSEQEEKNVDINVEVEDIMGDLSAEPEFDEDKLVKFVKDNKVDINGYHVQAGLQFKLLMLDSFLIYRLTFGEFEDVFDAKSFGSLNLRLGFGI